MTTSISTPPANTEAAALDLIVRIGEAVPGATALRGVLQNFAGALQVEGAMAGLGSIADARLAAATITEVLVEAEDPVAALRIRAAVLRAGCRDCSDRGSLAQALDAAATVWDAL